MIAYLQHGRGLLRRNPSPYSFSTFTLISDSIGSPLKPTQTLLVTSLSPPSLMRSVVKSLYTDRGAFPLLHIGRCGSIMNTSSQQGSQEWEEKQTS